MSGEEVVDGEQLPNFFDVVDEQFHYNSDAYLQLSTMLWQSAGALQSIADEKGDAFAGEAVIAAMLRAMSIEDVLKAKYYAREFIRHKGNWRNYTECPVKDHDLNKLSEILGIERSEMQTKQLEFSRDMIMLGRFPSIKKKNSRKIQESVAPG